MGNIQPTDEQLANLFNSNDNGPVVMINLLKFNRGDDGTKQKSADSYNSYMLATAPFLEAVGGKLLFMGEQNMIFIGDETDEWDMYLLVEYPSRKAFIEMITNQEYIKIHSLREDALENSALLITTPTFKGA